MSTLDITKGKIGEAVYSRIEKLAEKEVALAMQMPLVDEYHQKKFYNRPFLLGELLGACESFEKTGLRFFPTEVVDILFKCKLLFAAKTEDEYHQRSGGSGGFYRESSSSVRWEARAEPIDVTIDEQLCQLQTENRPRTLLAHISGFDSIGKGPHPQVFFEGLFERLAVPFTAYLDDGHLIEKYERLQPGNREYDQRGANEFFCAPSFGFTISGSFDYCFWHSSMWLRTFLNLLRIAGYTHPGQIDFGRDVKMNAPTHPVFLGRGEHGMFQWHEDMKESWAKIPDGCLFRSFGYRGLSNMWLDVRSFSGIEKFFLAHRRIFDCLKTPWNSRSIQDVAPALDILSSATQIPDLGAKILLIYCCLEHLFVPNNTYSENKKYIVGGMNALGPQLLPWFGHLYDLRCAYAHKGFVLRNAETMALVMDSMKNVMILLNAKLSVS